MNMARPKAQDVDIEEVTEDPIVDAPKPAPDDDDPWVVYIGHADVLKFGDVILLPGIPTRVSKDVAEGILTTPYESVALAEPPPADEE